MINRGLRNGLVRCTTTSIRNYGNIFDTIESLSNDMIKEMKKVEDYASDIDKEKLINQGTEEALKILKNIDRKVKEDDIQVTVGFNIGFFSVSLTSNDIHSDQNPKSILNDKV